ncbi:MAG: hypothetical protein WCQ32_00735 [bacterium]
MYINTEFEDLVVRKYDEAVSQSLDSILLEDNTLGELTLFIKEKPDSVLLTFEVRGVTVYVGANDTKKASS